MLLAKPSHHPKLGYMFRTYEHAPHSCPTTCPFIKKGCYAQQGPTRWHAQKNENNEVCLKDEFKLFPRNALIRHFVAGDVFKGGEVDRERIEDIRGAHESRPDVEGLGYTHGWRELEPDMLNRENLTWNASCETPAEVELAMASGWPTVMVVPTDTPKRVEHTNFTLIVCPNQQDKHMTCDRCGLCFKGDRQRAGKPVVVGFRAHSAAKKTTEAIVKAKLNL